VSVGTGNSFGREGPTVHICAAVSSSIGQWAGLAKARIQAMVPVGMGAGIAAAFNTPIAALFFVFEELLADFSSKALGGIVVAVVIAAIVERTLLGDGAALLVDFTLEQTEPWMLVSIPMGVAAAVFGHLFVSLLLFWRGFFKNQKVLPGWARPAIGGFGVGVVGLTVLFLVGQTGVFGTGHHTLNQSLAGLLDWKALGLLFVGKLLATSFCYGAGGSGGIFAPVLFMGSMLGGLFGWGMVTLFPELPPETIQACALLGTGSFFAAVIRCKFTSMLMIIELTQSYTLVLPLMAGNLLAYSLSYRFRPVPVYDALLLQDGISLKRMPTYRGERDWRNLPVSTIMTYDVVTVPATDHVTQALGRIRKHRHHAYPVLDGRGEEATLIGVITHHELEEIKKEHPELSLKALLKDRKVISLSPDLSIRNAANTLVLKDVLQAPVVSKKHPGKLLGIVTLHDIARQQNAIEESIGR
jgi:CIC family chloride channel protein